MAKVIDASQRTLEMQRKAHPRGERKQKIMRESLKLLAKITLVFFLFSIYLSFIYFKNITMCNLASCIVTYMLGKSLYSYR